MDAIRTLAAARAFFGRMESCLKHSRNRNMTDYYSRSVLPLCGRQICYNQFTMKQNLRDIGLNAVGYRRLSALAKLPADFSEDYLSSLPIGKQNRIEAILNRLLPFLPAASVQAIGSRPTLFRKADYLRYQNTLFLKEEKKLDGQTAQTLKKIPAETARLLNELATRPAVLQLLKDDDDYILCSNEYYSFCRQFVAASPTVKGQSQSLPISAFYLGKKDQVYKLTVIQQQESIPAFNCVELTFTKMAVRTALFDYTSQLVLTAEPYRLYPLVSKAFGQLQAKYNYDPSSASPAETALLPLRALTDLLNVSQASYHYDDRQKAFLAGLIPAYLQPAFDLCQTAAGNTYAQRLKQLLLTGRANAFWAGIWLQLTKAASSYAPVWSLYDSNRRLAGLNQLVDRKMNEAGYTGSFGDYHNPVSGASLHCQWHYQNFRFTLCACSSVCETAAPDNIPPYLSALADSSGKALFETGGSPDYSPAQLDDPGNEAALLAFLDELLLKKPVSFEPEEDWLTVFLRKHDITTGLTFSNLMSCLIYALAAAIFITCFASVFIPFYTALFTNSLFLGLRCIKYFPVLPLLKWCFVGGLIVLVGLLVYQTYFRSAESKQLQS